MFSIRRLTAVLAAAAALVVPAAAQAQGGAPTIAQQWSVNHSGGVRNDMEHKLANTGTRIGYGDRWFGVDLEWNGSGNFVFRRNTGSPRIRDHRAYPLTETENVSIYNTKSKRYLRYHARGPAKAELEWDKNPQFQWQIRRQEGSRFALFNDKVDKFLVHQVKNYGINLGWLEQGPPPVQSFSVPLSAQPVIQGWIPYLGTFGGGTRGKMLSVQNASTSATLLFVKAGYETSDCGHPSASVAVPPRAHMTTEQLKAVYGTATPALPVTFLACVTTSTPQSVSLTHVNITYRLDG